MSSDQLKLNEDPKVHLVRLVKEFNYAMLITRNASDQLRGRPMRVAKADMEQNLWFVTTMDSTKVEELLRDPRACITMQQNGKYISLSGNAVPSKDKGAIEEIWNGTIRSGMLSPHEIVTGKGISVLISESKSESFRPWFPEGKDTPDLVLLKINTTWGEYWDTASGEKSTLNFLSSAAKKLVGAEEKQAYLEQDHAKVSLTAPTQM